MCSNMFSIFIPILYGLVHNFAISNDVIFCFCALLLAIFIINWILSFGLRAQPFYEIIPQGNRNHFVMICFYCTVFRDMLEHTVAITFKRP